MAETTKKIIRIGTSGWTYPHWQRQFYPSTVRGKDRLPFYCDHFNALEINSTFYRLPTIAMANAWNHCFDHKFHLVLKASRRITHYKQIKDTAKSQKEFLNITNKLNALKIILWQLPPSLKKDIPRLLAFLNGLPNSVRHAIEFRHKSWWDGDTLACLQRHNTAMVCVSHPKLPDDIWPTTDFLYLRFHGMGPELYQYEYKKKELEIWADRLLPFSSTHNIYGFFNNDYKAYAIENAKTFREMLIAKHSAF